jgi:hypothetical protein
MRSSSTTARTDMLAAIRKASSLMHTRQTDDIHRTSQPVISAPNLAMKQEENAAFVEPVIAAQSTAVAVTAGTGGTDAWLRAQQQQGHPVKSLGYVSAKERRSDFFTVWGRKIEVFVSDPSKMTLGLPAELTANDRRELHQLAEKYNLSHHSEGVGHDRHLVLRKDELHFKAPTMAPSAAAIEALKNQKKSVAPAAPGPSGMQRNEFEKQSKFHLRRRSSPTRVEYEDELAAKAVRRLQRATDQYRDAADMGISTDELRTGLVSVDALLADSSSDATHQVQWARCLEQPAVGTIAPNPASAATPRKTYSEQCLQCATRVPVDFDLDKWDCQGFCAKCRKDTVWRLLDTTPTLTLSSGSGKASAGGPSRAQAGRQLIEANNTRKRDREEDDDEPTTALQGVGDRDAAARQRTTKENAVASDSQIPEEIVREDENDDDVASDLEEMTADDAAGIAEGSDMHARDVAWIKSFAEGAVSDESSLAPLSYRIRFCLDLADLPLSLNFYPRGASERYIYAFLRQSSAVKPALVSEILTSLQGQLEAVDRDKGEASSGSSFLKSLTVAFETSSSGAAGGKCICRVRKSDGETNTEALLSTLQSHYGAGSVIYGDDLNSLIASAANCA